MAAVSTRNCWSAPTARTPKCAARPASKPSRSISTRKASWPRSPPISRMKPRRVSFPLALSHAKAYTAPHLALVGDAAHTVHPLAGQGVNLGFLDAATLAEVLLDAAAKQKDIGAHAVLRRYERWRKGDNLAMVSITGGGT